MPDDALNLSALEPLFAPHEEPDFHRVRAKDGQPAEAKRGRRPSPIVLAQNLRRGVKDWRETDYPGAGDTTRELLHDWFACEHLIENASGERVPFRYYFCQREAIETLIFLYEVRGVRGLARLMDEFAGPDAATAAAGVNPDDDRWARYAFKLATYRSKPAPPPRGARPRGAARHGGSTSLCRRTRSRLSPGTVWNCCGARVSQGCKTCWTKRWSRN